MSPIPPKKLLEIRDLRVGFTVDDGYLRAVDGISLDLAEGESLGLVGESGCGKSVTALSLLRLIPQPPGRIESGSVLFRGRDLLRLPAAELRSVRGRDISLIFQEPQQAFSPLHRIGDQLVETLQFHQSISRPDALRLARDWLERVGIGDPAERLYAYPHQLSGGMLQRIMIVMALFLEPALIIADEPTTALDVTIQAQIFSLMKTLKTERTALILITHDLGAIWEMCDRVAVMYASRIVETGRVADLFARPAHPYTQALMKSIPSLANPAERLEVIPGQAHSPLDYPTGCRFRDRCPFAFDRCQHAYPPDYPKPDGGLVACFLADPEGQHGGRPSIREDISSGRATSPREPSPPPFANSGGSSSVPTVDVKDGP
jgi:peptide/nickel transport system ATP-binding protein/oligopeptide transport system ATP-binding protein